MLTRTFWIVGPVSLLYNAAGWPAQATHINPQSWANFLSPFTGHTPLSEQFVERDAQGSRTLSQRKATRVRKMSGDESEMFLPHFWDFEPLEGHVGQTQDLDRRDSEPWPDTSTFTSSVHASTDRSNASVLYPLQAPLALHKEQQTSKDAIFGRLSRAILYRDTGFKCPSSSSDCSSIGRPNSCCSIGLTCQLIQDSGEGDVGCCSEGQTCDGTVQCAPGYSGCPGNDGGGCCLPGFECYGIGCKSRLLRALGAS